ncbi:MAG: FtsX-like permease family protein [Planctomycetota bacterium]
MTLPLYYNWRNLLGRRLSTALTLVVVSVVVFTLALLLSFAGGIRRSLVTNGSRLNVLVLKPGATSESTSILRADECNRLAQTPGVARLARDTAGLPAGTLLISPELSIQTTLRRRGSDSPANVGVRGVDDVAFLVHPEVRIVAGRAPRQGALEVLVGQAACERYQGLALGAELPLGRKAHRQYRVVGVFAAGGGALESELWCPRTMLSDVYFRAHASSVCLRMTDEAAQPAALAYINGPAVQLAARPELTYYEELAAKTRELVWLASVLIALMASGAVFAVMNTMYSAVDARRREIAMLRTIGFRRGAILLAFLLESVLLCAAACALGLVAALALHGSRQDYLSGSTFTVLAYELRLTPGIAAAALGAALGVGLIGALAPALRAARVEVLQAMRKG